MHGHVMEQSGTSKMNFLFPPRPEKAIAPSLLGLYERRGYIAQLKKNGTCQVIIIGKTGCVNFKTRHNEDNKAWQPPLDIIRYFANFPDSVFVGELLHNKHPSVKNTIVLFDILRFRGEDQIGVTLAQRLYVFDNYVPPLMNKVQITKTYRHEGEEYTHFKKLYDTITDPIDEGLVLKDPLAPLKSCLRDGMNKGWQVKVRKGTKNYGY